MFSTFKKTPRKGEEKKLRGKARMFTYRHSAFSRRAAEAKPYAAVGAWFVGPKAENAHVFTDLATKAINSHFDFRKGFYPCDPPYVTDEVEEARSFKLSMRKMEKELDKMQSDLYKSVPFFSTRYKGHVNWDTAVPANLGYIASILWNQNNCANEASPMTTTYELEAGSDLCEMIGLDRDQSMGHLVAGGSVANIEAMWVARNMKYYPLGLKEALLTEDKLSKARGYKIYLPQRGDKIPLVEATAWELLNLDSDTILEMPSAVPMEAGIDEDEFRNILDNHLYESVGTYEFCRRHNLTQNPCVVVASTYHVSFMKAVSILGLGKECLVTVPVDVDARMKTDRLKEVLEEKLRNKIPVISVISVIGTTEESAVDPLAAILDIRKKLSKKGLNFSIHADAAWGAYFSCMLKNPPEGESRQNVEYEAFVPELSLNKHVIEQLKALKHCDTITCDPHKSGFCPYPAGAICYRKKEENNFLNFSSGVVYYHGQTNLGDVGVEGSKPGAAASGVLLANKVIGLHKDGYGRILSQCMFTSKILYCYWVCLAEDDDNFVVETTKPLPSGVTKEYIRNNIIGKTNEELANDVQLMKLLQEIGPDTLIPCLSVNTKDNTDVQVTNNIIQAVFNDLSHISDEEKNQRIPMIVTQSTMEEHKHSIKEFKERLGLEPDNKDGVKYIITTCMDPWSTSMEFVDDLAAVMRNTILNAIGTVKDPKDNHSFVSGDRVSTDKEIFVCYVGNFNQLQRQYFAVARFRFLSEEDVAIFEGRASGNDPKKPIVLRSCEQKGLHDLLYNDTGTLDEEFNFYEGLPTESSEPFMKRRKMKIVDVPRYDHFDKADDQYPEFATYILYGEVGNAYLFHSPTKDPDYLQIIRLTQAPTGLGHDNEKKVILKQSVDAELLDVSGSPNFEGGKIVDPLQNPEHCYKLNFIGIEGKEVTVPVKIERKIWFDGEVLNEPEVS